MGYCCTDRCPNTPHAWQLGWITAQQINGSAIKPGQTLTFSINSQAVSRQAGLRITGLNGSDPLFVGYRTKAGGDAPAPVDIAGVSSTAGRLHLCECRGRGGLAAAMRFWLAQQGDRRSHICRCRINHERTQP